MRMKMRYCSWCGERTDHVLKKKSRGPVRNLYECCNCHELTLLCLAPGCKNMTRGPSRENTPRKGNVLRRVAGAVADKWCNKYCSEHNGSLPSFSDSTRKLDDLEEYNDLLKRKKHNYSRTSSLIVGRVGGCVVFVPFSLAAAGPLAAGLGHLGVLGTASTGTAISTLHGAALTSASLAAIGGGTMAGTAILTATGAALGGLQGARISYAYSRNVKGFEICRVRDGREPGLVFVNGFLSQRNPDHSDWEAGLDSNFSEHQCYLTKWESKCLYSLGSLITKGASGQAFRNLIVKLAKRASRKAGSKLNPLTWATAIADIVANPWHTAVIKAGMTGVMFGDALARTTKSNFVLMGHSLGCRAILHLLAALSSTSWRGVQDVYLFGGACDRCDGELWKQSLQAVTGRIYNCYSSNDGVLKYLYGPAVAFVSNPIGLGPIEFESDRIINVDVSDIVGGHMQYKENLSNILKQISH